MREVIHSIGCPCSCCRGPAEEPALPEFTAAKSGLIAGVGCGAVLSIVKQAPILIAWLLS